MLPNSPLSHLSEDELKAAKVRFAALLLKTPEVPLTAALGVFAIMGQAIYAAYHWPNDPDVKAEQAKLLEHSDNGELSFVPTKADAAREAWKMVQGMPFVDDRLKAIKLFAEIMGYIQKPETVKIDQSVVNHNRVMLVKDHGTDNDWEAKLREQQERLTRQASENVRPTSKH